ncbi:MAG: hypothetical protein K2H85_02895 [Allobaculum sp.]|nr:hypothetical protein [Allobaculum sp.]
MKTTIFKFHYKDHLVRAVLLDGRAYVLGPDIMPLFGYKKQPLVDINQLLTKGSDKKFIYDVPVISLAGIKFLEAYPKTKKKKARKVSDWVSHEVISLLESPQPVSIPDDVRTESWEEYAFKNYLEAIEYDEENRLEVKPSKKTVFEILEDGESVAKVKIKEGKCSIQNALEGFLESFIFSEVGENPDGVDALDVLHKINREVMTNILEHYENQLMNEVCC